MSVGLERFPHLKTLELSLEIWVESVCQAMGVRIRDPKWRVKDMAVFRKGWAHTW